MPSTEVRASIPKRWFESGVIERSRRDDDPMAIFSVSRCLCGFSEVPRETHPILDQVNAAVARWPRFADQASCTKKIAATIGKSIAPI